MLRFSCFILFIVVFAPDLFSQTINSTKCDSAILTREEFEKCRKDSLWGVSIVEGVNYISYIKSELLPKYRPKRLSLEMPGYLQKDLMVLRKLYDSTVGSKLDTLMRDMDRNQRYVQPKSYISSLLYLEQFRLYPDVYAILLNPIHLQLRPQSTLDQQSKSNDMVQRIYHSVLNWNNISVKECALSLAREKRGYSPSIHMFQGSIEDEERAVYDIVNYLLWTE